MLLLLTAIDVIEYAKCRAAELQLLDEATKKRKVSQAVNGLMSISMRRRAMSHNVKRMPRRVREVRIFVLLFIITFFYLRILKPLIMSLIDVFRNSFKNSHVDFLYKKNLYSRKEKVSLILLVSPVSLLIL